MKCNCENEMIIIKTTGKSYTYKCFRCGNEEQIPKKKKKPLRWWQKLGVK